MLDARKLLTRLTDLVGGFVHVVAVPHIKDPASDGMPIRLAAVDHAVQQLGRFVTTREVTEALPTVGFAGPLDKALKTRLWQTLATLASPKKSLTPGAPDDGAMLQMVITQRPNGAGAARARVYWWATAGASFALASSEASASPREAAMRLVQTGECPEAS